jgi:hypothetical protein
MANADWRNHMEPTFDGFEGKPKAFDALRYHLLVVGQSGSGKSYFLGKMIEELAAKTTARIVVLDPAGDFVQLQVASDGQHLLRIPVKVYSEWGWYRTQPQLPQFEHLTTHPSWFDPFELCAAWLLPDEPPLWALLGAAQRQLAQNSLSPFSPLYSLSQFMTAVMAAAGDSGALKEAEQKLRLQLPAIDIITEQVFHRTPHQQVKIDSKEPWADTPALVAKGHGVQVVDLSALRGDHAKGVLTLAILRALWREVHLEWAHRHLTDEHRNRTPTFLVIDEAHHFCPVDHVEDPIAARVREALLQIASEGRKYGLWLICGTQRPLRLHPTIMSEAGNFLIMKTISPLDQEAIVRQLSLRVRQSKLGQLESGRGYLAGAWAEERAQRVKVAERISLHPKGEFEHGEWLAPGPSSIAGE